VLRSGWGEPGGGPRGKYRDAGCGFEGATKDMLGRRQIVIGEVRDPKVRTSRQMALPDGDLEKGEAMAPAMPSV
jgi:hypothetical protein